MRFSLNPRYWFQKRSSDFAIGKAEISNRMRYNALYMLVWYAASLFRMSSCVTSAHSPPVTSPGSSTSSRTSRTVTTR